MYTGKKIAFENLSLFGFFRWNFCSTVARLKVCWLKIFVAYKFSITDVCVVSPGLDGIECWISVLTISSHILSGLVKSVVWVTSFVWWTLVYHTVHYLPFFPRDGRNHVDVSRWCSRVERENVRWTWVKSLSHAFELWVQMLAQPVGWKSRRIWPQAFGQWRS